MEKEPQNKHDKDSKKEEKNSKLSSALKKNLLRRKAVSKTARDKKDE
jgi:hypothetical protein